jgi:hypothetical protein
LLTFCRAFIGPAFVIGGWQLIGTSYVTSVALVYVGFVLCLLECMYEPFLLRGSYVLQVILIGMVFGFADLFAINLVSARRLMGKSFCRFRSKTRPNRQERKAREVHARQNPRHIVRGLKASPDDVK